MAGVAVPVAVAQVPGQEEAVAPAQAEVALAPAEAAVDLP